MGLDVINEILIREPELNKKVINSSSEGFKLKGSIEAFNDEYDVFQFAEEKAF